MPTYLIVEVPEVAVGVAFHQFIIADWRLLAFFSKMLKPIECKYNNFDWELFAVYLAIKHFYHFLDARQFSVRTDHKPLTFILHPFRLSLS